ncbi:hypothetical protein T459_34127 [Capsicum annuum]|uniref:RING-type domain-containing protein n=1 Tax=Capsicum annuum TaxID=4072 RepID=A0A2G2XXH0_CAPAN|nr:hypothetical protein T459_34127 [Capsicum annuum]
MKEKANGVKREKTYNVNCKLERNDNGSYIVRISVTSIIVVAELRRPLALLMRGKIVQHMDITPTVVKLMFYRERINTMRTVHRETGSYIHLDKHSLHVRIFGSSDNVDRAEQRFINSLLALYESKQLEVHLRGGLLPPDQMKRNVITFGPNLSVLKEKSSFPTQTTGDKAHCVVCLCELEDPYRLKACTHAFCRSCLLEQCESAIKSQKGFLMCCLRSGFGEPFLLVDLKSLLSTAKLEELFRASLRSFVTTNAGTMVDMETYGMDETSKWIPLGDGQLIPSKNNKHWSENEQHRKGRSKMETHPQKEVTELEVPMAAGWEFF